MCLTVWGRKGLWLDARSQPSISQKHSGDSNPQYFSQKYCHTNGGRTAVQMGGVLQYKWEAYCSVSLSSKLRSQESTAIQMGGVLPYKLEVYCRTFSTSCRGWGFRNIAQFLQRNGMGSHSVLLVHFSLHGVHGSGPPEGSHSIPQLRGLQREKIARFAATFRGPQNVRYFRNP